jgi:cytochrome P450
MIPEIDPADPAVLADPVTAYAQARELLPLARLLVAGFSPLWVVTRHSSARAMLADARFALNTKSFMRPPGIPEDCQRYMRTMSELDGPEHLRLRRLAAPAFTPRRANEFRPKMAAIVGALLDGLPAGEVDLLAHFARPLPMEVICELVGIPAADRPQWKEHGAAVAAGFGAGFTEAIPAIMAGAKAAVARRRAEPGDDLLSYLIQAEGEEKLSDTELVTLVWHLVIAGQTPTNFIANAVEALLTHPGQLALLRADMALVPQAVEELMRWCSPQLLTAPRYASEDVEIEGVLVRQGEAVTAAMVSANRDPRAFDDPDTLDITRSAAGQLGFGHGPHFCLGASLARVQTEVALTELLNRFPNLKLAKENLDRAPDGGTWRLASLPVIL